MFTTGQSVKYKDLLGFVDFIDDDYITICIKSTPSHSKRGSNDCCLCVYPDQYHEITPLDGK